jgi:hypothetical protein
MRTGTIITSKVDDFKKIKHLLKLLCLLGLDTKEIYLAVNLQYDYIRRLL